MGDQQVIRLAAFAERACCLLVVLCGAACTRPGPQAPVTLASQVRRALAEREQRLTSFQVVVDTTEGERRAHHEFWFRSPNRSRGHVTLPQEVEVVFDGTTLKRVLYPSKAVEVVPLDLPPADRAYFLASTFMPFAPEGYRAPLLPQVGVEAKAGARADTVEVTISPGQGVTVVYVLRMPNADFLEKRMQEGGQERVLRVTREHCDPELRVCVPTGLVETMGGQALGTTEVTKVVLNPQLPETVFQVGVK